MLPLPTVHCLASSYTSMFEYMKSTIMRDLVMYYGLLKLGQNKIKKLKKSENVLSFSSIQKLQEIKKSYAGRFIDKRKIDGLRR